MLTIPGIDIKTQIYESTNSVVYRGTRNEDQQPLILKVLKENYPTPAQLARYRSEYNITKSLNLPGVIRVYDLQPYQNTLVMFLEDFGGESLKIWMQERQFTITEILQIALKITETLGQIHAANIIHKDINPANIVFNPSTEKIKIIDFGISTQLTRENPVLKNPNVLEGTLPYLSPEQTGRMNRSLDYRSDFYSLGVTFYELFTGQLPFATLKPLELVHCHIAKQPLSPSQVKADVPPIIAEIILKLLAKNAEERYQSAYGIKADLELCLRALENGENLVSFPLGCDDISEKFQLPQKLYGREREIETLLKAFDRASSSQSELILVAGYSGVGKSALIQELYKPVTAKRGYFIKGKFDQFQRNIPYSAVVQALQELIKQILAETETELNRWREKMIAALGVNGQIIIDVIPEVELIIGQQPPVPELGANESQNRFNFVFQNFIKVFTKPEHPLVLFLDDLQWADGASLKLMQLLMNGTATGLLLIGAYRDNEVLPTHPLMLTIEIIAKTETAIERIFLSPLDLDHVTQFISDSLKKTRERVEPLAELVFVKTGGNPFFMSEFLKSLYKEEMLKFAYSQSSLQNNLTQNTTGWYWDLEKIKNRGFTDNVVELMTEKIQKLPLETQNLLKIGACLGNQFDLVVVGAFQKADLRDVISNLAVAVLENLVIPLGAQENIELALLEIANNQLFEYRFVHDRIQQAAYLLIPENQRASIHQQIGNILLKTIPISQQTEKIFAIVNQLNFGIPLLDRENAKIELAQLNLNAGQKAKAANAYGPASQYLQAARELLPTNSWSSQAHLTLKIYIEAAEVEYLSINFAEAYTLTQIALEKTKNILDKVKIYELQMQICIAQLAMVEAVEIGFKALEQLGINLVAIETEDSLIIDLPNFTNLATISVMTDPYKLSAMTIMKMLCAPVFMAKPEIFPQLILTMINLCLNYGNSGLSSFAYGFYGLLLSGLGKLDEGYQAGKIALTLWDKFNARDLTAKVYNLFNSNIRTWKEHTQNSITPLQEAVQIGLETGDLEWGGYCAANLCSYLFFTENNLGSATEKQALYVDLCQSIQQEIPTNFSQIWRQLGLNLQGATQEPSQLIGESFNEAELLPRLIATKTGTVLFVFYVAKTILLYHLGDYPQALHQVALAIEQMAAAFGFMQVAILNFYHSLALLASYHQLQPEEQKSALEQVTLNQKKMQFWASHAPMNYQHKFDLVAAEKYRVLGNYRKAIMFYDSAITGAKVNGYIQDEALANELTAKFYLAKGKERIGKAYFEEARYYYQLWGANLLVKYLEQRYQLTTPQLRGQNTQISITTTDSDSNLDIATLIKATQVISGEIMLDNLLASLMRILMQNAGAQRGCLILANQGQLLIEAEGNINSQQVTMWRSTPITKYQVLSEAIVNYVARTQESLVLNDATQEGMFTKDPYLQQHQPKSILCVPLINQGQLISIVYLENNLSTGAFTPERVEILQLLSGQAAISLQNAKLYTEVKENESRLTQFLEAMPVGVGILDASGKPYYINRAAQELLGKGVVPDAKSDQIATVYKNYKAGTDEEYPSADLPIVRALQGESTNADDIEIRQGDKIIPIEGWGRPIYNNQGEITYAIVAFQDITERKKAEADREKFTQELYQLNQAYQRFVPSQFLQFLNKSTITDVELGDQIQLEMSVLFCDIRNFTTLSETMTPEDNFKFINSYLSRMEPAITDHQGFIDKYIGDAIMALFSGQADNAVKAGISMLERLEEYNQHRANSGYQRIKNGIGINTGSLMLGTVGGKSRMDGTVISDAVNLASRVENLTKNYGVALLITQQTYQRLQNPHNYAIRIIDTVKVKGKSQSVTVYEVFDNDPPEVKDSKLISKSWFEEGLLLYQQDDFRAAIALFSRCLEVCEVDRVARIYSRRCEKLIRESDHAPKVGGQN